jgi:hypothetical protein
MVLLIVFAGSLLSGYRQPGAAMSTAADACALLTSAEIESILGESVKERRPGTQAAGGLLTEQCFFATSSSRSVSLTLTRRSGAGRSAPTPREYWRTQFHGSEHARKPELESRARPISGVGEEAYWTGNRLAGALYVLKEEAFLRISVGGLNDERARIAAAKALALAAVTRF